MHRLAVVVAAAIAASVSAFGVQAEEFPTRTVRLIVPYPAGGGVDNLARPLAERLSQIWKLPVIIENKPGASTMIGAKSAAGAPADGTTLLFTTDTTITSNPFLFKNLGFDPIKELMPVTQLVDLHQFVLVNPAVGVRSMQALVELAKREPDKLNYGSYGIGSQPHLLFEMLRKETGAQIRQISYRGIAPAVTAVLAGEVQLTLGSLSVSAGHIDNGKLVPLAISRKARLSGRSEIPTLIEAGYPGIDPRSWYGLFAPAGTPPALVAKVQKDVAEIFRDLEFKTRHIDALGYTGSGSTPAEFAAFIRQDLAYKENLIKVTGITAEQ
ncbi:MAG: tripartite tricarboxylate transporter substrate binding protein [Xanthobacteraceae bacterium]|nr:tripartite tricarboxylate transporter substrate binding protein [Xanthobacteraceae bacterium]